MQLRTVLLGLACLQAACDNNEPFRHLDGGLDATIDVPIDADPDGDGDGARASVDCDDGNELIHPGALERCNTTDDDCDQKVDETSATFENFAGVVVDISDKFAPGTPTAPVVYRSPPSAGKLTLCGGTYYARIEASANLEIAGKGAATTIVDAAMTGHVVRTLGSNTTINIHDVTLTRGMTGSTPGLDRGGGVFCKDGALTIANAVVSASVAAESGGGVMVEFCSASFTDVVITGNQADLGGGVMLLTDQSVTMTRVTLSTNTAAGSGGGLMHNTSAAMSMVDSTLSGNTSGNTTGGGVYSAGAFTCTNSAIVGNAGLGIYSVGNGTITSTTCDFGTTAATNNTPSDVRAANGALVDYGDDASFACSGSGCN